MNEEYEAILEDFGIELTPMARMYGELVDQYAMLGDAGDRLAHLGMKVLLRKVGTTEFDEELQNALQEWAELRSD